MYRAYVGITESFITHGSSSSAVCTSPASKHNDQPTTNGCTSFNEYVLVNQNPAYIFKCFTDVPPPMGFPPPPMGLRPPPPPPMMGQLVPPPPGISVFKIFVSNFNSLSCTSTTAAFIAEATSSDAYSTSPPTSPPTYCHGSCTIRASQ